MFVFIKFMALIVRELHKVLKVLVCAVLLLLSNEYNSQSLQFNNPLAFYNTDILSYLQILHKNQQYENMLPFLAGNYFKGLTRKEIVEILSNAPFGYSMKRSGVKEILRGEKWSLTYQRIILGTQETFKIDCALITDTCRVVLSDKDWGIIFK